MIRMASASALPSFLDLLKLWQRVGSLSVLSAGRERTQKISNGDHAFRGGISTFRFHIGTMALRSSYGTKKELL